MSYQQYMNMGFGVPGGGHPYMMGFQGALPMQMPQMPSNPQQYIQNHRPAVNPPVPSQPTPSKGGKRKLIGDPNRPKRPTSAYFYFVALEREEAAKRGEKITRVAEWTKQISVKWRELTVTEKDVFQRLAATDKIRYTTQMAAYTGKDANRPKRPQSAYFLWLADFRARMKNKFIENKDILRAAGEEWRQMTTIAKAPYEQLAEEERRKYEQAMKLYNQNGAKKPKLEATASTDVKPVLTANSIQAVVPPPTSVPIQYHQQLATPQPSAPPSQMPMPPQLQPQLQPQQQQQLLQMQMHQQQQQQQSHHNDEYDDDDDDGDDEDFDDDDDEFE